MKKILTIGGAMLDTFIQYDAPESLTLRKDCEESYVIMCAGRKIDVRELIYYCGGGAANSAVSFARLGFGVEAFFKIGSDKRGDIIIQSLAQENVSTHCIVKTSEVETGTSFIIPGPSGNNVTLAYRGANLTLKENEISASSIKDSDQLYITSLNGPAASLLTSFANIAKKYNKKVAVNPGTGQLKAGPEFLKNSLPYIDILIVNSYEAQLLMTSLTVELPVFHDNFSEHTHLPHLLAFPMGPSLTCFTLIQFFQEIQRCGPRIVVVTNGADGVYVADEQHIYFHPSRKINIVSSLGAGDAFGSTFVAFLNKGASIEDSLRAGIINSASVIEHLGTQTGLLSQDNIEIKIKELDQSLLQKYKL